MADFSSKATARGIWEDLFDMLKENLLTKNSMYSEINLQKWRWNKDILRLTDWENSLITDLTYKK